MQRLPTFTRHVMGNEVDLQIGFSAVGIRKPQLSNLIFKILHDFGRQSDT